jgi:hypothetical protein
VRVRERRELFLFSHSCFFFTLRHGSLVRDEQTHPHRPRLVVSHSTCPPLSSPPPANSFVIGPAVINTHTKTSRFRNSGSPARQVPHRDTSNTHSASLFQSCSIHDACHKDSYFKLTNIEEEEHVMLHPSMHPYARARARVFVCVCLCVCVHQETRRSGGDAPSFRHVELF